MIDRKSTRLNSSHLVISYAVFCLKKKKKKQPGEDLVDTHGNRTRTRHTSVSPWHLGSTATTGASGKCGLASGVFLFFFFNDTATTEIYTLSLHDALPIWRRWWNCLTFYTECRVGGCGLG